MTYWKLLTVGLVTLGMAACGGDEEPERMGGQDTERTEATTGETGREGPWEETPSDPEEAMGEPPEESRELWAIIQEEQSELTGEQQRALQACAEIKIRDQDIALEEAVVECREEMEEMAEEQQDEEENEGGEGE
jgi:hypothetical protein